MSEDEGLAIRQIEMGLVNEGTRKLAIKSGRELYQEIISLLDYYLDIPEDYRKIISLWCIGTYVHKEFASFPFLFFNAMRGSGKSRALNLIASITKNGKLTNNITEAVLFRTAASHTLIIDESESLIKKEKSALRELLNSAYKKGTYVERMKKVKSEKGEEQVVEKFSLYSPIAMANISGMEEVLGDRCITLILEKSDNPGKTRLIEDFDTNRNIKMVKRTFDKIQCSLCNVVSKKKLKAMWNNYISHKYNNYIYTYNTLTTLTTLTTQDSTLEEEDSDTLEDRDLTPEEIEFFDRIDNLNINGRNLELFFPLINIAKILGDDLVEDILRIAKTHVAEKRDAEYLDSPDVALFEFVSNKSPLDWYPVSDLVIGFKQFYISDESDRDWLNSKWMGRALRRLRIVLEDRRESRGVKVLLDIAKAKDKLLMFKNKEEDDGKTS